MQGYVGHGPTIAVLRYIAVISMAIVIIPNMVGMFNENQTFFGKYFTRFKMLDFRYTGDDKRFFILDKGYIEW